MYVLLLLSFQNTCYVFQREGKEGKTITKQHPHIQCTDSDHKYLFISHRQTDRQTDRQKSPLSSFSQVGSEFKQIRRGKEKKAKAQHQHEHKQQRKTKTPPLLTLEDERQTETETETDRRTHARTHLLVQRNHLRPLLLLIIIMIMIMACCLNNSS
jgi:hypothetical protein